MDSINITYLVDSEDVMYILKTMTPTDTIYLDRKPAIMVYIVGTVKIGVYNRRMITGFASDCDLSNYEYESRKIKIINSKCKDILESFDKMKNYNIFNEVDIQHYEQKMNDALRKEYDTFENIIQYDIFNKNNQ